MVINKNWKTFAPIISSLKEKVACLMIIIGRK